MSTAATDAVSLARALATARPGATMPCPCCAAGVQAVNLDRHLAAVHPDRAVAGGRGLSWTGPERLVLRPLILLGVLSAAGVIAWSWHSGRELRAWFLVEAGVVLVVLVLATVAAADVRLFLGRLSVSGDGSGCVVRLRHTLLLCTRTLRAVDRVEVGSGYRLVPDSTVSASSSPDDGAGLEMRAGVYLRVHGGHRAITVHCRNSTGLRSTWTGWRQGKRRRRWDITLSPADFVGLQYALAAAGQLQLREP